MSSLAAANPSAAASTLLAVLAFLALARSSWR
jgi:hypothetical protein